MKGLNKKLQEAQSSADKHTLELITTLEMKYDNNIRETILNYAI